MLQRHILPWIVVAAALPVHAERRYILEAKLEEVSRVVSQYGLTVVRPLAPDRPAYVVSASDASVAATLEKEVQRDSAVREFVPDELSRLPESDPASRVQTSAIGAAQSFAIAGTLDFFGATVRAMYVQQPAAALVHWQDCHKLSYTGSGIVAILDTGVDPTHPVLRNALVPGYDFVRETAGVPSELRDLDPAVAASLVQSTVAILDKRQIAKLGQSTVAILDQSTVAILDGRMPPAFGHGTLVAGLVHLVAPSAKIMPLKVFQSDGTTRLSDIVRAIYYAVDHGAKAINMSFSMPDSSRDIKLALDYASSKDVITIASAGNDGLRTKVYPAAYQQVIGVGSTNLNDLRSVFSNYGESCARMAAPGEALVTTFPGNNYAAVWGTSFSAALVSGAVGLMNQVSPNIKSGKVHDAMEKGREISQGLGESRLDCYRSVLYLRKSP